jgi:hypothetical protein
VGRAIASHRKTTANGRSWPQAPKSDGRLSALSGPYQRPELEVLLVSKETYLTFSVVKLHSYPWRM